MKKVFLLTIIIVSYYVSWGVASPNIDDATKFINTFLEAEFSGDQSFRVDNAVYSAKRKKVIEKKYSPMIGEIFYWESETLSVVDNYEVTNTKKVDSKVIVDVTFEEFACTGGKGYGRAPLIKKNKKSLVRYSLEFKEGRWWMYDPPIPRVSRRALIDYNDKSISQMRDFVMEKGSKMQKDYYYNLIDTNNLLKGARQRKEPGDVVKSVK